MLRARWFFDTGSALLRLLAIIGVLAAVPADAQTASRPYPERPVRIIVPIAAGGAPDIAARLLGDRLSEALGQPFVVENKPGSNGNIATEQVVKAAPDGYTLLLAPDSTLTINPHVYPKLPFDPFKDLVPITLLATNQFVLSVNPSVPATTVAEFVAYARKTSPPLSYASGGNGSQHHLGMEHLKQLAGIDLLHVPYKSAAPAVTATIAGETSVLFSGSASAPHFKSGALRPLAVSGAKRSTMFPTLPRVADTYPGFDLSIWLGLVAPAGTPDAIVEQLAAASHKILSRPDFADKLNVSGSLEPMIATRAEFSALIKRDYERYGLLVKALGVRLE